MSEMIREKYLSKLRECIYPVSALTELMNDADTESAKKAVIDEVALLRRKDDQIMKMEQVMRSIAIKPPDGEKYYLRDEERNEVEIYSHSTLSRMFTNKGLNLYLLKSMLVYELGYNPGDPNKIFADWDGKRKYNQHKCASWRAPYFTGEKPLPKTELPQIIRRFFSHLTGGENEAYSYLMDWSANSLNFMNKNRCYLVIMGVQGLGKGAYGALMAHVHGQLNYKEIKFSDLGEQFNGFMAQCSFLFLDEAKVYTKEEEDSLKTLRNDRITVNEKFLPKFTTRNYASIYLASNHLHALRLSNDDTRYSILDTNKHHLRHLWEQEPWGTKEAFFADLHSDKTIHDFGVYLLQHSLTHDMTDPYKNRTAAEAMQASTMDWENAFLGELAQDYAGKELTLRDAISKLNEEYVHTKARVTTTALAILSSKYPGIFEVGKRKTPNTEGKRPMTVYFLAKEEQFKYDGINT